MRSWWMSSAELSLGAGLGFLGLGDSAVTGGFLRGAFLFLGVAFLVAAALTFLLMAGETVLTAVSEDSFPLVWSGISALCLLLAFADLLGVAFSAAGTAFFAAGFFADPVAVLVAVLVAASVAISGVVLATALVAVFLGVAFFVGVFLGATYLNPVVLADFVFSSLSWIEAIRLLRRGDISKFGSASLFLLVYTYQYPVSRTPAASSSAAKYQTHICLGRRAWLLCHNSPTQCCIVISLIVKFRSLSHG